MEFITVTVDYLRNVTENFFETYEEEVVDDFELIRKRLVFEMLNHFYANGSNNHNDDFWVNSSILILSIKESCEEFIEEVKLFDTFAYEYQIELNKQKTKIN